MAIHTIVDGWIHPGEKLMFKRDYLAIYMTLTFFLSTAFAEIAACVYSILTHSPFTNFPELGLWFVRVIHGYFYNTQSLLMHANPHEYILGLGVHIIVAVLFAGMYILYLQYILKTKPTLINGLVFGLLLVVFPFLFELPSMGEGIMGIHSSGPVHVFFRVIIYHAFFGLGLGFGGILTRWIECR